MISPRKALVPVLLAVALVTAGCGSGSSGSQSKSDTFTVGTSPTISNVSLYYARDEGMFKANSLEVSIKPIQSGAAAVPLLLNGQLSASAADPVAVLLAASKNIPISIVAAGNIGPSDPNADSTAILAGKESGISSAKQMAGKTIGVNALNSLSQVMAQGVIDQAGGDWASTKFVEVPLPQMVDAIANGQVDAGVVNEPFTTVGQKAGLVRVASPSSEVAPSVPLTVYVSGSAYASKNREAVASFADAMAEAGGQLSDDPDAIRKVGATSTLTPPELLKTMALPVFNDQAVDRDALDSLMQMMVKYGVIAEPVDLDKLIVGSS